MDAVLEELQAEYPWVDEPSDSEFHRWHLSEIREYYESDADVSPKYNPLTSPPDYGEWILQEPITDGPPQPKELVRLRLFCFPQVFQP